MVQGDSWPCMTVISAAPPPRQLHGSRKTGGEAVGEQSPPPQPLLVGCHDADKDDEQENDTYKENPKPPWDGKLHIHARVAVLVRVYFDERVPRFSHIFSLIVDAEVAISGSR